MRKRTLFFVLGLAGLIGAAPAAAETAMFPPLAADTLSRERVSLPGGLAGRYNLVVVAYRRQQQADVDTWMPTLNALEQADPRLRWYELPTIGRFTGVFVSWWLDDAMRSGIPDLRQRARTITLYVDKDWFRGRLGLPQTEDAIHLLLLDKAGRVLWRHAGRFDETAAADLRKRLATLPR